MCVRAAAIDGSVSEAPPRRRRLWEIESHVHCSIIGTCLGLVETRKLMAKAGLRIPPQATDFDIHTNAVRLAEDRGAFAKAVTKVLDRRHRSTIARYAKASSPDSVEVLWNEDFATGAVAGAYWSVMTHPLTTPCLARRAFGDIHMVSHLMGASARVDVQRLKDLETHVREIAHERDAREREWALMEQRYTKKIEVLERRAEDLADRARRHESAWRRLQEIEGGKLVTGLRSQLRSLEHRRDKLEADNAHLERKVGELDTARRRASSRCEQLEGDLVAVTAQHEELERRIMALLSEDRAAVDELASEDQLAGALDGKTVLLVGSVGQRVQHYRALVERCGGQFLHHDGGREHCIRRLPGLLGRADVVVCPLDAVSHAACRLAREICKRMNTPFKPMRQSGLGTFVQSLDLGGGTCTHAPATEIPN